MVFLLISHDSVKDYRHLCPKGRDANARCLFFSVMNIWRNNGTVQLLRLMKTVAGDGGCQLNLNKQKRITSGELNHTTLLKNWPRTATFRKGILKKCFLISWSTKTPKSKGFSWSCFSLSLGLSLNLCDTLLFHCSRPNWEGSCSHRAINVLS